MKKISLLLSTILFAQPAFALDVKSPYVEKGMVEIESKNRFDFDKSKNEDRFRQHKIAVGYGINDWWQAEIEGEFEKNGGHGYKYNATAVESVFQFTEHGEYAVDIGMFIEYEFAHPTGSADKLEAFLLLAKDIGKFTTIANVGFEQEVGSNRNKNPEFEVKLLEKYNYSKMINPAIEYYGELGEATHGSDFNTQKHRIGPVLQGKLGHGVKYDAGVLFGISKGAEDYAVKLNLEYEFPI